MNIKDYRDKDLTVFIIVNTLMILYFSDAFTFLELSNSIELFSNFATAVISTSILSMLSIIIDAIIPKQLKQYLVFWNSGLPGESIFTKIKDNKIKDKRFSNEKVCEQFGSFYKNLNCCTNQYEKNQMENNKWYFLYKKVDKQGAIVSSQRDYLICRDFTVMTVVVMFVYLLAGLMTSIVLLKIKSFIFLFVEYLLTMIATRCNAKRFVLNVIASAIMISDSNNNLIEK